MNRKFNLFVSILCLLWCIVNLYRGYEYGFCKSIIYTSIISIILFVFNTSLYIKNGRVTE